MIYVTSCGGNQINKQRRTGRTQVLGPLPVLPGLPALAGTTASPDPARLGTLVPRHPGRRAWRQLSCQRLPQEPHCTGSSLTRREQSAVPRLCQILDGLVLGDGRAAPLLLLFRAVRDGDRRCSGAPTRQDQRRDRHSRRRSG